MKRSKLSWVSFLLLLGILACSLPLSQNQPEEPNIEAQLPDTTQENDLPGGVPGTTDLQAGERIQPEDLNYLGAFRLPDASGGSDWDYSGQGLTYYPDGDPQGPEDGFPGSLFGVGHDQQLYVSEIAIPAPVISRNLEDLNTANTLQPFQDNTSGIFSAEELAIPIADIAYLPPQSDQTTGKLHFVWGQHFQDYEASHGWSELDLSSPQAAGPWQFGDYTNYVTSDYLFEIPEDWANTYLSGQRLATGRFREGVWGGFGPVLFAFAPWQDGNPPAPNATLNTVTPLLLYGIQEPGNVEITTNPSMAMDGYQESDHWWGAAWLTSGSQSAVIFSGTKAMGSSWYGFANGVTWDYECAEQSPPTCPDVPEWPNDNRGYWAEEYQAQLIFYDTNDLAAVAQGEMQTFEPQPYASLDLTSYLYAPALDPAEYKRDLVGAVAFDRDHAFLYIFERLADEYKSVVHVFQLEPGESASVTLPDSDAEQSSDGFCQPFPQPDGPSVTVSTEAELREQAFSAAPGTSILIEPGIYEMQNFLHIVNQGIALFGLSGNRDDVILDFGGMDNGHFGIMVESDNVFIANLTIRNTTDHGIAIQGADRPLLHNLHILDSRDQLVKVNPVGDGSEYGILACSLLEYSTSAPDNYTNGISAHNAHNWTIRDNRWERIRTATDDPAPTILFWSGSSGTIVERNTLVDCYQGISFGNASGEVGDHTGGIVRNNFIYSSMPHDVAIEMVHASGWHVANNTVILVNPVGELTWGMEARFTDTWGFFNNNLTNLDIFIDRDNAQASASGNVTNALLDWFIDPGNSDLHLTANAVGAIDQALQISVAGSDIDGQTRPIGEASDIGADEFGD